jgi:succinoglycan biosynthesis protein ExoL
MHLLTLFFVIDSSHTKKRIDAFKNNVDELTIVSYYRTKNIEYKNHYNLGKSSQKHYFRRFIKLMFDIPQLSKILSNNPEIDVVYAWNFDIALLFVLATLLSKRKYTFIYEVADIKPILLSKSIVGNILRKLEQLILNSTNYLCVTSKDFIINYFDKYYNYIGNTHILENKVFPAIDNPLIAKSNITPDSSKWRIGYFGLFRCNKSLQLLLQLANSLPNNIEIILAGRPEIHVKDIFNKLITLKNSTYIGEYKYPDDLPNIYSKIDIIWSADFSDPSDNSKWLLPNRIYEAGLFNIPQLCFSDNVTICKYIDSLKIGWVLEEANISSLLSFFSTLTSGQHHQIKSNYSNLSANQFSGDDQIYSLLNKIKDEIH